MKRKLYFCETLGYDMVISVDEDGECRYLTETYDFPSMEDLGQDQKKQKAFKFLEAVEDDSSWSSDLGYDEIFVDGVEVIAEIEKWI